MSRVIFSGTWSISTNKKTQSCGNVSERWMTPDSGDGTRSEIPNFAQANPAFRRVIASYQIRIAREVWCDRHPNPSVNVSYSTLRYNSCRCNPDSPASSSSPSLQERGARGGRSAARTLASLAQLIR